MAFRIYESALSPRFPQAIRHGQLLEADPGPDAMTAILRAANVELRVISPPLGDESEPNGRGFSDVGWRVFHRL